MAGCCVCLSNSSQKRKSIEEELVDITRVNEYLCLSGCSGLTPERLKAEGITAVVNCIRGLPAKYPSSIAYLHVPIDDDEKVPIAKHFDSVLSFIHRNRLQGGRILVYCGMGISRSVTFILAYLLKYEGMSLREAYKFLQAKRRSVCPNAGFFRQLIVLERSLKNGVETVKMITPSPGVDCADVVWEEVYKEVAQKFHYN